MVQAVSVGADIQLDLKLGHFLQCRMLAEVQSTYQFVQVQPKAAPPLSARTQPEPHRLRLGVSTPVTSLPEDKLLSLSAMIAEVDYIYLLSQTACLIASEHLCAAING